MFHLPIISKDFIFWINIKRKNQYLVHKLSFQDNDELLVIVNKTCILSSSILKTWLQFAFPKSAAGLT